MRCSTEHSCISLERNITQWRIKKTRNITKVYTNNWSSKKNPEIQEVIDMYALSIHCMHFLSSMNWQKRIS